MEQFEEYPHTVDPFLPAVKHYPFFLFHCACMHTHYPPEFVYIFFASKYMVFSKNRDILLTISSAVHVSKFNINMNTLLSKFLFYQITQILPLLHFLPVQGPMIRCCLQFSSNEHFIALFVFNTLTCLNITVPFNRMFLIWDCLIFPYDQIQVIHSRLKNYVSDYLSSASHICHDIHLLLIGDVDC